MGQEFYPEPERLPLGFRDACGVVGHRSCDSEPLVRQGRVIRPMPLRFDSDLVIHGDSQLLLAPEVMLSCLDRHMPDQELNLVEFTAGHMTEARTGAPQV